MGNRSNINLGGNATQGQNLSGGTGIYAGKAGGYILQFKSIAVAGGLSIVTGNTKIIISGGTSSGGSSIYNLQSPAAVTLGGITCGEILTGKTTNCILQDLLVPELFQTTVTAPTRSIALSPSTTTYEIGCTISTLSVTGSFNRGLQCPAYCGCSQYRTGAPNTYCFSGAQIAGSYSCSALSVIESVLSYGVSGGTATWGVCVAYDAGECPVGSKGTPNSSVACCPASTTAAITTSITGILPWYWGVNASNVITGGIVAAGNKTVAVVGASTPITFNATTQYLWFAAPAGTTPKTKWWVCAANAGTIGNPGDLWAAACSVAVTSGQGCWAGCSYDVYVTCGVTTTGAGVSMCLYY